MINSTLHTILLVLSAVVVTVLLRAFPFIVFHGKEMPDKVKKVADSLPPAIIGVLVVYCLKDGILTFGSASVASLVAIAAIIFLHLWKKNVLLSIAVGTAIYMILIRIL